MSNYIATEIKESDLKPETAKEFCGRVFDCLKQVGIVPTVNASSYTKASAWVNMGDMTLPFSVNGKGINKEAALKSGAGETIERVQTGHLLANTVGSEPAFIPFDAQLVDSKAYYKKNKSLINTLMEVSMERFLKIFGDKIWVVPYLSRDGKELENLPLCIIKHCCGSTGMASGSSMYKALLRALCEILERYVLGLIIKNNAAMHTIPNDYFKLYPELHQRLNTIEMYGYKVLVKESTMEGLYPHLTVILFSRDREKYITSCGCSPYFNIAVNHALSEIFQGKETHNMEPAMTDFNYPVKLKEIEKNMIRLKTTGLGKMPFLQCNDAATGTGSKRWLENIRKAFKFHLGDEVEDLKFIAQHFRGKELYVRNYSYLGFPTCHIYIPGMSNYLNRPFGEEEIQIFEAKSKVKRLLSTLPTCNRDETKFIIDFLKKARANPIYSVMYFDNSDSVIYLLTNLAIDALSDLSEIDINLLMSMMAFRIQDYETAYQSMTLFIKENWASISDPTYYNAVALFLKLNADGLTGSAIKSHLFYIYGEHISAAVLNDLSDPANAYQYYNFPACNLDCAKCKFKECHRHLVNDTAIKLNKKEKEANIDQMKMLTYFE